MSLFPHHPVSRGAAALWFLACLTFLALTLLQAGLYVNDRNAFAMMVPVYFLAFPFGHIAVLAIARIKLGLYMNGGLEPDLLAECLMLWTCTVVLGYLQWFIFLPWLARKCWQVCGVLSRRNSTRGLD